MPLIRLLLTSTLLAAIKEFRDEGSKKFLGPGIFAIAMPPSTIRRFAFVLLHLDQLVGQQIGPQNPKKWEYP